MLQKETRESKQFRQQHKSPSAEAALRLQKGSGQEAYTEIFSRTGSVDRDIQQAPGAALIGHCIHGIEE